MPNLYNFNLVVLTENNVLKVVRPTSVVENKLTFTFNYKFIVIDLYDETFNDFSDNLELTFYESLICRYRNLALIDKIDSDQCRTDNIFIVSLD